MTGTELKSLIFTLRTSHRRIADMLRSRDSTVVTAQAALVSASLRRMAEGTYGCCIRCHKQIGMNRLSALPHASLCITCQEDSAFNGAQ
jgi:RNA polymerase-binding transcription factor DksA